MVEFQIGLSGGVESVLTSAIGTGLFVLAWWTWFHGLPNIIVRLGNPRYIAGAFAALGAGCIVLAAIRHVPSSLRLPVGYAGISLVLVFAILLVLGTAKRSRLKR
jgi:hypothetical protein